MTTNIEMAGKLAREVALQVITLRKANVETDFDPVEIPEELAVSQQYRCAFEKVQETDGIRIDVLIDFTFFAKGIVDGNTVGDVFKLDATFLLVYRTAGDFEVEADCYRYFAEINGPYNCWPYWRELVQTATGRAGLSGFTIPVFRPVSKDVSVAGCEPIG